MGEGADPELIFGKSDNAGSLLERVQLHPSILVNGCMHPSIFRAATTFTIFCLFIPGNVQVLHPSIEISNKGTVTYLLRKFPHSSFVQSSLTEISKTYLKFHPLSVANKRELRIVCQHETKHLPANPILLILHLKQNKYNNM